MNPSQAPIRGIITTSIMQALNSISSILQLVRLASPSLPIGSYSYSQGLEHACEAGWVSNFEEAGQWLEGVMLHGLAMLDIPLLSRMYDAVEKQDMNEALRWSRYLLACRETSELRKEDRQTGLSLARLLRDLGNHDAAKCMEHETASLALSFSLAAHHWQITAKGCCYAYLWSWLENQVAAAVKLVPLGQTDGQRLLDQLIPVIEQCLVLGMELNTEDIEGSLPGLALGSARHENQYSRLFQS